MSAHGYRLDSQLLAIERRQNNSVSLRVLAPGTEFIVLSGLDTGTGMVEIASGEQRLAVFRADLENRASPITMDR